MQRTAEAVSLGHPDKVADYISSYILDRMIEQDKNVRYAVEVMIKDNTIVLGGEITTSAKTWGKNRQIILLERIQRWIINTDANWKSYCC